MHARQYQPTDRNRHEPRNRVLVSIETDDGGRCADILLRPDGTTGFKDYRRDSEDRNGRFPAGFHKDRAFATEAEALAAARVTVAGWLECLLYAERSRG